MQGAFKSSLAEHDIHFHVDSVGRPYVCDYAQCESPGVSVDEARLVEPRP
jgi:hypothetical protein